MSERRCDGVLRRDWMRIGGLSALGLGMADFLRLRRLSAAESPIAPKAKSCILIWMDGGPSHLETFDPKPNAPEEVRGPMSTLGTNLPGVRLGECLERTATCMDKLAVIRSMTSPLGEHNFGTHYMMTGYRPTPALEYPTFGATLSHLREKQGVLPPHIAVPEFSRNHSGNGFLSASTRPFAVGGNPGKPDFRVRDLDFYRGLDLDRLNRRREMVQTLDSFSRRQDASPSNATDPDLQRAYDLIASPEAKRSFRLSEEPDSIRQQYGLDRGNNIGQCCLLARRLVERGVPFVTVNSRGWDTHQDILKLKQRYPTDRNAPLPTFDRAFSGLIQDLDARGMLDETLVVAMGEFGRTPKINSNSGRDHWPNVFSVVLAGGGIQGGQVHGASDALAEYPQDNPVTPSDLAATIYTLLGVDPNAELHTSDGRPVRISPDGAEVIRSLIG